jgi:hypothetical protein
MSTTTGRTAGDADSPNTLVNALLGGIAAVVLAFLPFSTVLGGALAGYLQGPDTGEGLRVGALAGVVAAVPFALLVFLFGGMMLAFVPFGMGMGMDPRVGVFGTVGVLLFLLFVVVALVYTVGLAALGGVLGAYLNRELD